MRRKEPPPLDLTEEMLTRPPQDFRHSARIKFQQQAGRFWGAVLALVLLVVAVGVFLHIRETPQQRQERETLEAVQKLATALEEMATKKE